MINYKGTPLLGEDSNPQHTSEFFAIAGTVLFWLIFTIFSFVIKPQPDKPKYKEVQIVLSSTPVVQKTEEAPAPAEAASASAASSETVVEQVVETPAVEPPAPKDASSTEVKTSPKPSNSIKKSTTEKSSNNNSNKFVDKPNVPVPSEPDNTVYSTDLSNGFDFNSIKKNKPNPNDMWDLMDNEVSNNDGLDNKPVIVNSATSITGEAATASNNDSSSIKSSTSQKDTNNYDVTSGDAFSKVLNANVSGISENGAGKNPNKSNSSDKNSISWEGSNSRSVYSFDTELSQKAKSSMQVSKPTPFTITFSVDADGNVMVTTIEIKNEFILSDIINKEMRAKISSWKFGKGTGISKARFDWILSPGN